MLSAMLCSMMAAHSGILAVDGMGVGIFNHGKWASMDSMFLEGPKVPQASVTEVMQQGCFVLTPSGEITPRKGSIIYVKDDDRSRWEVKGEAAAGKFVWFGSKPAAMKVTHISNGSPIYIKVAQDFLKTKGYSSSKPMLHSVDRADLDGDGAEEVVIVFASRKLDDMRSTFAGNDGSVRFPADYMAVLVRYASGKSAKTCEAYYTDGRKSGLNGNMVLRGMWNLDGMPGAEMVLDYSGYESSSSCIMQFTKGKCKTVAEAGDGA